MAKKGKHSKVWKKCMVMMLWLWCAPVLQLNVEHASTGMVGSPEVRSLQLKIGTDTGAN